MEARGRPLRAANPQARGAMLMDFRGARREPPERPWRAKRKAEG
jgi:hypothetical protein